MCLGEVAQVRHLDGAGQAQVGAGAAGRPGRLVQVSLLTLDLPHDAPLAPGDWVLHHCGFALARLTPDEALEALRLRTAEPASPNQDRHHTLGGTP